ncbi:hypothetical protein D3C85_1379240 [compost metagenome]
MRCEYFYQSFPDLFLIALENGMSHKHFARWCNCHRGPDNEFLWFEEVSVFVGLEKEAVLGWVQVL